MDYGGNDRRKTKGDLKRKRRNRVYKRGGQFRTHDVGEDSDDVKRDKMGKEIRDKKKGGRSKR